MANEWRHWEEVKLHVLDGRRLFRSSAPNYYILGFGDLSQRVTPTAVAFLSEMRIDTIISFCSVPYNAEEQALVKDAGILYHHLPVRDLTAPTLEQLQQAAQIFNDRPGSSLLVHCGYGRGRTGTGITALQLFESQGAAPDYSQWRTVNHVEKEEQMAVLTQLRDHYLGLR